MKTRALVIALSLFFTQAPLKASIAGEILTGFNFGYITGLVPIAGQIIFQEVTKNPQPNENLLLGSIVVGHIAGVATISTAFYYGIRGTYRYLTRPKRITALQLVLAAHQQ